jgi:phosphatidylinositol glycan class B
MMSAMPALARRAAWLGAAVLLCAAIFSEGVHHADEHYQILEFAGWKLGITPADQLPWEFAERMRPALQPAMVVAVHRALAVLGEPDPFTVTMLMRMFAAALTFLAALLLLRGQLRACTGLRPGADPALSEERWLRLYLFLAFFLWFGVYCGVRFSSEGFSAALFAIGYAEIAHRREGATPWAALLSGALLGLAVVARLHMALMVAGLVAWCLFVARRRWAALVPIIAGGIIGFAAGAFIDRWFYGEWVLTAWNYIDLNLLQGKAASFGTQPWWHYFAALLERMVPPFSLLFLAPPLVLFALRRRDPLTWTVLPFLLAHMLIGHKEYRFMFPVLPLLPALVVGGLALMQERGWFRWPGAKGKRILRAAFLLVHVPMLAVVLIKPAQLEAGCYRALHGIAQPGDMLLYTHDERFRHSVPVWYTRPRGLGIAPLESLTEWPSGGRVFFASHAAHAAPPKGMQAEVIQSAYPEWLLRIGIGGWSDGANVCRIWEVQRPSDWEPVEH